MKIVQVEGIEVFEWYDGLVLGLIRADRLQAVGFLLAFDPDRRKRKLCLIPVTDSEVEYFLKLFNDRGPGALNQEVFRGLLANATTAYFTDSEPERGTGLGLAQATHTDLQRLPIPSFPQIDNAVSESAVSAWLRDC